MPRSGADAVSLRLSTPSTRYCVRLTGRSRRREDAIEEALSNKLAQRALKREADAAAAQREIENFTFAAVSRGSTPSARQWRGGARRSHGSPSAQGRVQKRRAQVLPAHRQGPGRDPEPLGDRRGRQVGQRSYQVSDDVRRREPVVPAAPAAPQEGARGPGRGQVRRNRHRASAVSLPTTGPFDASGREIRRR